MRARDTFLVDGTGLFEASRAAFLGVPALSVDGHDHTFLFGVTRDLLRLRQRFGVNRGLLLIGEEVHKITSPTGVENTVTFLKDLGVPVVHDPLVRVLDLSLKFAPLATCVITHCQALLRLAAEGRRVILLKGNAEVEIYTSDVVLSKLGVAPEVIPGFLALISGPRPTTLTRREAIGILGQPGDLARKVADPSVVTPGRVRAKLRSNSAAILQRLKQFAPSDSCSCTSVYNEGLDFDVDNDHSPQLLAAHGFHSLVRLLSRPAKSNVAATQASASRRDYHAVTNCAGLERLVRELEQSRYCALDTESSGKDPHSAELFGVSLSIRKGGAFYVPMVAHHVNGVNRDVALRVLRRLLGGTIRVRGHNLKYDYVLLRKNGIEIANIDFDTMLAAYDCYGDPDVLSLQRLAQRHLGRTIKSYREVVSANQSLLDLPFPAVADYACEHAEVTLQLGRVLEQELAQRGIDRQHRDETLKMVKTLGDWEVEGIALDVGRLGATRDLMVDHMTSAKKAVVDAVGHSIDI